MPGRQSKALDKRQIDRLKEYQRRMYHDGRGGSIPQLKLAMAAPFTYTVLSKALKGEPVWIMNHSFIVEWIDRYVPERGSTPVFDFDSKRAAAGEREEVSEDPAGERQRLRSE